VFYRAETNLNAKGLTERLAERSGEVVPVNLNKIKFNLAPDDPKKKAGFKPTVRLDRKNYPATEVSLAHFAEVLGIPPRFLKKLSEQAGDAEAQHLLSAMLDTTSGEKLGVRIADKNRITGVYESGRSPMDPYRVAERITNVVGPMAKVVRLVDSQTELSFDVAVNEDYGRAYHVEDKKVGDITAGGLRCFMDLKRGLTPQIDPYAYRLFCTNGMTMEDPNLKIEGRGQTVDQVLDDIERMAEMAMGALDAHIAAYYDLRSVKVDNPERAINAIAREQKLPDRTRTALIDLAAGEDLPDNPTQFDIVNLITNFANSEQVRNNGARTQLERVGGAVITDHAVRCGHCSQRVHV
jgi:hypothetical protein